MRCVQGEHREVNTGQPSYRERCRVYSAGTGKGEEYTAPVQGRYRVYSAGTVKDFVVDLSSKINM